MSPPATQPAQHRDLVTAYLLALAGLPFTLQRDGAGLSVKIALSIG